LWSRPTRLTVRELHVPASTQQRNPRLSAVGLSGWMSSKSIDNHLRATRQCCLKCGRVNSSRVRNAEMASHSTPLARNASMWPARSAKVASESPSGRKRGGRVSSGVSSSAPSLRDLGSCGQGRCALWTLHEEESGLTAIGLQMVGFAGICIKIHVQYPITQKETLVFHSLVARYTHPILHHTKETLVFHGLVHSLLYH